MSQDTLLVNGSLVVTEDSPKVESNGKAPKAPKENPPVLTPLAKVESSLTKSLTQLIPTIQADSAYKVESGNPKEEKELLDRIESVKKALIPLTISKEIAPGVWSNPVMSLDEVNSKVKEESAKLEKLQSQKKDNMAELLESLSTRLSASLPEGYTLTIAKKSKRQTGESTGKNIFYLEMADMLLLSQPELKHYALNVKIQGNESLLEKIGVKQNTLPKEYNQNSYYILELGNVEFKTKVQAHESSTDDKPIKTRILIEDSLKKIGNKAIIKSRHIGEFTSLGALESHALDKLDSSKEHNTNGLQNSARLTIAQFESLIVPLFK